VESDAGAAGHSASRKKEESAHGNGSEYRHESNIQCAEGGQSERAQPLSGVKSGIAMRSLCIYGERAVTGTEKSRSIGAM
jgi:hypothetical protein